MKNNILALVRLRLYLRHTRPNHGERILINIKKRLLIITLAFLALPLAGPALADSMYCGQRIVSTGDTKPVVLLRCGEPFYRETVGIRSFEAKQRIKRKPDGTADTELQTGAVITVERWYYNLGSNQFIRAVTFEGDTVVRIEELDYP